MNSTTLLAFLYAILTENVQDFAFKKLATELKCQPLDWEAVQEKVDDILSTHPKLEQMWTHCKTQLESKTPQALLALLPSQDVLNQYPQPAIPRSGLPGNPDKETIEITNTAVVILQSDKPAEMAQKLLQPLTEKPKSPQPVGND
ncbi:MAG: hypothetical protein DRR16_20670 [Candidatus Parabeggiatoa sp. nov. 3]|nr:MAG: hypothetical protein DRR00_07510 [Gammaproteobacteria bacterium]RKZ67138.1 MAG: hypothetical protein DRQ99_07560 [Gammaproteobacteria bacterium]RKZ82034.1 MAG: hypothetical protein DRR16_20670 [Gammaproteobacteria bacterium]